MRQKQRRWQSIFRIILVIILILIALCAVSLGTSKFALKNSEYEIASAKAAKDIRIVELADLHNAVFGKNNVRLVSLVRNQEPDLILMVGDMVQQDEADLTVITNLICDLTEVAPVYFSIGNHEEVYQVNYPENDLIKMLEAAGAIVLDKDFEDITIKGTNVRIGGIYGYCLPATEPLRQEFAGQPNRIEEMDWLLNYQDTDELKLLMCHMPVCWIENGSLEYYDVDVVFAGHAHGGQVRLPFIGGFYAPDQGWFPGREEGLYIEDGDSMADTGEPADDAGEADTPSTLVLSRGLGSEMKIPRFCNTPQVITVTITAEN